MKLFGLDFTSRPRRQKPLTLAEGTLTKNQIFLTAVHRLQQFEAWEDWLHSPGPWLMACDFPFGLPRPLLCFLGWPESSWADSIQHLAAIPRGELELHFARYRNAHPPGQKYAHRAADLAAVSSSSMKLVNPPVGLMLYEGAPRLLNAGVTIPGLHSLSNTSAASPDRERIAVEAYPGLLARRVLGRLPYKNDDPKKQLPAHAVHRATLLEQAPASLGFQLHLAADLKQAALADPSGDNLDAILCLLQAAWSAQRAPQNYGIPGHTDPVEGWIVTA